MSQDAITYWLGLVRIEGLGIRGAHRLIDHFGSAQAAYTASLTELESCGIPPHVAQAIFAQEGLKEAESDLVATRKANCQFLTYDSEDYPPLLRQIPDAPLVLFVRGDVKVLSQCAVAIVGTRKPSAYGSQVAHRLARDLAERQVVIVSGLARGIDSCGHRGALEAKGGRTIAVQGRGMDEIYPRENRKLGEKIAESGAVISEFPIGVGPLPENFPIRNRIISGLSLGVLVVEAAEYSGSLITARLALDQNREVFAVPGNITSAQSFGPNHLIKQGAKLVDQWMDVVEEFPAEVRRQLMPPDAASEGSQAEGAPSLFEQSMTADQKAVFDFLRVDEPAFIDSIFGAVAIPPPRILQTLLELEMNGLIRQLPGKNFIRKL
ncbi:MAG: DNA-protecting protein DprA [Acidobacteria bacterium]|nr:DNA-protecting protein DprA [Acidobacteriota bacterium]